MNYPDNLLVEEFSRLSPSFRWRDRCLTAMLWMVWWHPLRALAHLAGNEGAGMRALLIQDLLRVSAVAAVLVVLLLTWGACRRRRARSCPDGTIDAARGFGWAKE